MKLNMRSLDNITWERLINENAVTYPSLSKDDPGQAIVFGNGFPRQMDALASLSEYNPPDDVPDSNTYDIDDRPSARTLAYWFNDPTSQW